MFRAIKCWFHQKDEEEKKVEEAKKVELLSDDAPLYGYKIGEWRDVLGRDFEPTQETRTQEFYDRVMAKLRERKE